MVNFALPFLRKRQSQPQSDNRVNDKYSRYSGIVWNAAFPEYVVSKGNQYPITNALQKSVSVSGKSSYLDPSLTNTTATISGGLGNPLANATKATIVIVATPSSVPAGITEERIISKWGSGNDSFFVEWYGSGFGIAIRGSAVEARYASLSGVMSPGKKVIAVCTWDASRTGSDRHRFWVNGNKIPATDWFVSGDSTSIRDDATYPIVFGSDQLSDSSNPSGTHLHAFAIFPICESDSEAQSLSINPWKIFKPARTIFAAAAAGGSLAAAATGGNTAGGSAALAAQVALASVGVAVAGGSANAGVSVPLSAAGIAVAGGSANAMATITLSASGLAQAAGQAGLSASVLLAGAGAAQAAGNATLAAQLNALAAGAAQAGGTANLTGGAPGSLSASGGDVASGSAVLSVTVGLQAAGGNIASGSANGQVSSPGAVSASGGAQAAGSATWSATIKLTAAGFVQAMGTGQWSTTVSLSAFASSNASGAGTLADVGNVVYVSAPSGSGPTIIQPAGYRPPSFASTRPANTGGRRA